MRELLFGEMKMKRNASEYSKVYSVSLSKIIPNKNQPRTHFDRTELESLAESIKNNGLIQPVTLRKVGGEYELISGERRFRAAKLAGLEKIPAIIIPATEEQSAVLALIENLQRSDLNPFETALAIKALINEWGITQEAAAKKLSMSQPALANKLRLLNLTPFEQELIIDSGLTERHARALLKLQSSTDRLCAIEEIRKRSLNVSQTEKLIEAFLSRKTKKKPIIFVKDVRLFVNTIHKAVDVMHTAGIDADFRKIQHKDYVEFNIKVPMEAASRTVGS